MRAPTRPRQPLPRAGLAPAPRAQQTPGRWTLSDLQRFLNDVLHCLAVSCRRDVPQAPRSGRGRGGARRERQHAAADRAEGSAIPVLLAPLGMSRSEPSRAAGHTPGMPPLAALGLRAWPSGRACRPRRACPHAHTAPPADCRTVDYLWWVETLPPALRRLMVARHPRVDRAFARLPTAEFAAGVAMIAWAYAYYFVQLLPSTAGAVSKNFKAFKFRMPIWKMLIALARPSRAPHRRSAGPRGADALCAAGRASGGLTRFCCSRRRRCSTAITKPSQKTQAPATPAPAPARPGALRVLLTARRRALVLQWVSLAVFVTVDSKRMFFRRAQASSRATPKGSSTDFSAESSRSRRWALSGHAALGSWARLRTHPAHPRGHGRWFSRPWRPRRREPSTRATTSATSHGACPPCRWAAALRTAISCQF